MGDATRAGDGLADDVGSPADSAAQDAVGALFATEYPRLVRGLAVAFEPLG